MVSILFIAMAMRLIEFAGVKQLREETAHETAPRNEAWK
jgi:hypothetical protein